MIPMKRELKAKPKKLEMISTGVFQVMTWFAEVYLTTVLKRIIATASFTTPSPNKMLNNFGCLSQLMSEIAAIVSVEHKRLHNIMHSGLVIYNGSHLPVLPSYCCILSFFTRIVKTDKLTKATKVPKTPSTVMLLMLAKKLPLCMLKPLANTMGGKQTKKKVLLSNLRKLTISLLSEAYAEYEIAIPIKTMKLAS